MPVRTLRNFKIFAPIKLFPKKALKVSVASLPIKPNGKKVFSKFIRKQACP
jgi:hypothetical protein